MKKIIIVGNGDVTVDYAQLVNDADFVVRFNEMRNYGGNTGTKVDALCVTNLASPGRKFSKYKTLNNFAFIETLKEIWFPRPSNYLPFQFWFKPFSSKAFSRADYRKHIIKRNNFHGKEIVSFSNQLYTACCDELGIDHDAMTLYPSTGYLAIKYVLQRFMALDTRISLIGFTFNGTNCHKWNKERENIIKLLNDNILNLK